MPLEHLVILVRVVLQGVLLHTRKEGDMSKRSNNKNMKFWDGVDTVTGGCAFLFVGFIYLSFAHAAIFRRDEVDWSLCLPIFIILNVFLVFRWFFEGWLQKEHQKKYTRNRKATVLRIDSQVKMRERLTKD